ncbi:NACHT domain-containing protein [Streptomyces sp. NPDC091280]|uniref:NACHT domain-containing protein n=1 Tax=Streptomyces sp. NPDC091280 TaxID=3365984 RepID=UPI0037F8B9FD
MSAYQELREAGVTRDLPSTVRKLNISAEKWTPLGRASYEKFDEYGQRTLGHSFGLVGLHEDLTRAKAVAKAAQAEAPEGTAGQVAYQLLKYWSKNFGALLDATAAGSPRTSGQAAPEAELLSQGLFVERSIQTQIVLRLREATHPKPLLVTGEAGHGKSSLLWGIRRELTGWPSTEVFLVDAAWLIRPASRTSASADPLLSADTLIRGAREALNHDRQPVVLLDTADLLLRDDHTNVLVDLCDRLTTAEVRLVVTSRPEEARLLDEAFTRCHLGPYDDTEMAEAVRKHGRAYCPDAVPHDETTRLRILTEPEARGLPIREVCRNPLHLRLLFELAGDDGAFPGAEIDVTGLYGRYWRHRVRTDRRGGADRPWHNRDLAAVTGDVAVAIMSAGGTELDRAELSRRLAPAHGTSGKRDWTWDADLNAALDELVYRGVLLLRSDRDGSESYRFFHQTMFEFAAAHGLLDRSGDGALSELAEWVEQHPRDFYVGAVLEQLLLQAAAQPSYQEAVRGTLERLAAPAGGMALHNVAIAVAARHPGLGKPVLPLLDQVPEGTARRYAVLAPAVQDADVDALLPFLRALWTKDRTGLRTVVLEALERLAAQNLCAVHQALKALGCLPDDRELPQHDENLHVLCRVITLTATIDPELVRHHLMQVLTSAVPPAGTRARGKRRHRHELAILVLQLFARNWADLGSMSLASAIRRTIEDAQPTKEPGDSGDAKGSTRRPHLKDAFRLRSGLAEVLAAEWTLNQRLPGPEPGLGTADGRSAAWYRLLDSVAAGLEKEDQDTRANAELIAVAQILCGLEHGHWAVVPTLRRLFRLSGAAAPFTVQRALAPLLTTECAARTALLPLLTDQLRGLPARGNDPDSPKQRWAVVARNMLSAPNVPMPLVRTCVRPLTARPGRDLWLREDGLAALLVAAALGGHEPAANRLNVDRLASALPSARLLVRHALLHKVFRGQLADGPRMALLVDLAVQDADTTQLRALVTGHADRAWPPMPTAGHAAVRSLLRARNAELKKLITGRFSDGTGLREAIALWDALVTATILPAPEVGVLTDHYRALSDRKTRETVIRLVGSAAVRAPDQYREAYDFLLPLVTSGGVYTVSSSTQAAARGSLLGALCEAAPLTDETLELALELAVVPPTTMGVVSRLGRLVKRLAERHGAVSAAEYLLRIARTTARRDLAAAASKSESTLANGLHPAMDALFLRKSAPANELIWRNLRGTAEGDGAVLSDKYAKLLVKAAARNTYETVLPDFRALLADPCVSAAVKGVITHHMRLRERSGTDQDLSWVLGGPGARGSGSRDDNPGGTGRLTTAG